MAFLTSLLGGASTTGAAAGGAAAGAAQGLMGASAPAAATGAAQALGPSLGLAQGVGSGVLSPAASVGGFTGFGSPLGGGVLSPGTAVMPSTGASLGTGFTATPGTFDQFQGLGHSFGQGAGQFIQALESLNQQMGSGTRPFTPVAPGAVSSVNPFVAQLLQEFLSRPSTPFAGGSSGGIFQ